MDRDCFIDRHCHYFLRVRAPVPFLERQRYLVQSSPDHSLPPIHPG